MNAKTAELHLAAHGPGKSTDARIQKALKFAENESMLREKLAEQTGFDRSMVGMLEAIRSPEDIRARLEKAQKDANLKIRSRHAILASFAVGVGLLVIAGLIVFFAIERSKNFPGREALEQMAATANRMTGSEMDPVAKPAEQLADWFYMRGFESYRLPTEMRKLPAVGSRLFRRDGHMVGQVAIDRHDSLLYIFRGEEFGVQLPADGSWKVFSAEGWAAAARAVEGACAMVAFRGTESEMGEFLDALKHPAAEEKPAEKKPEAAGHD